MRNYLHILVLILNLSFFNQFYAQDQMVYLLEPSRDGKKQQILQIGENNGVKLLAMASCKQCMPAVYTYNPDASKASGKTIYGTSGIYVIPYDENSYISVAPKTPAVAIGEGIWETFLYANFFSADKAKVAGMNKKKVEDWAIDFSKQIMTGGVGAQAVDSDSNLYYPAAKELHNGESFNSVNIDVEKGKELLLKLSNGHSEDYSFMIELSKVLGVDVYDVGGNRREYMFVESPLSIIWAKYSSGSDLGKSTWGTYETFNYFHKDQKVIRNLLVSKETQDKIDAKLEDWSLKAKEYTEKTYAAKEAEAIKNRRLPAKGFSNLALEKQATLAAKSWASQYHWEETIIKAYFTGNDWSIYRNTLTGVQLGRRISGVIIMKRKDGKCSFQYATFAQQYNGNGYQKVFTEGIVRGQNVLECTYVK
ncbi:hypothetical protein IWQ47_000239 [Aquimarina sp. EL_43]|uniref:hypothetical protein n=1 Tax=unclassified Aquimarina TaxID=2627091 RepID=UPI0018C98DB0|nr:MULTISPECIES: hypothetical protein [unclassified Aquimarina]MBG6129069.1 hypothetical protein [Aquimarina sp. EL_35]MBG6150133.1 hypothetical protein [Aquimarina sp. EL_32]MBG6167181.1 hypothetical protein [Aquimarina sp. EL_43]